MTKLQKEFQNLASSLALVEGKKSQVKIGDIRELLSQLGVKWYMQVIESNWRIDRESVHAIDVLLYLIGEQQVKRDSKSRGARKKK